MEDFYDETITENMDLYPIIRKVQAKDPDDADVDIRIGIENGKVNVFFDSQYSKPYIVLHIEDIGYDSNGIDSENDVKNAQINIYKDENNIQSAIASGVTDANGDSTIRLYGDMSLTQDGDETKDDVFIYQLLDEDDNVVKEFSLTIGESKTIEVPYNEYRIVRKGNWAWRYTNNYDEELTISNITSGQEVLIEGDRITNKWFDATNYIDNRYQ